jgi:hypothetical protein
MLGHLSVLFDGVSKTSQVAIPCHEPFGVELLIV